MTHGVSTCASGSVVPNIGRDIQEYPNPLRERFQTIENFGETLENIMYDIWENVAGVKPGSRQSKHQGAHRTFHIVTINVERKNVAPTERRQILHGIVLIETLCLQH